MRAERKCISTEFVTLHDMPFKDAQVLYTLLRSVGGAPTGPRGVADRIKDALDEVGISYSYELEKVMRGSIVFPNKYPIEDV